MPSRELRLTASEIAYNGPMAWIRRQTGSERRERTIEINCVVHRHIGERQQHGGEDEDAREQVGLERDVDEAAHDASDTLLARFLGQRPISPQEGTGDCEIDDGGDANRRQVAPLESRHRRVERDVSGHDAREILRAVRSSQARTSTHGQGDEAKGEAGEGEDDQRDDDEQVAAIENGEAMDKEQLDDRSGQVIERARGDLWNTAPGQLRPYRTPTDSR